MFLLKVLLYFNFDSNTHEENATFRIEEHFKMKRNKGFGFGKIGMNLGNLNISSGKEQQNQVTKENLFSTVHYKLYLLFRLTRVEGLVKLVTWWLLKRKLLKYSLIL